MGKSTSTKKKIKSNMTVVKVYSAAFLKAMLHAEADNHVFEVSCNLDGILNTFDSLDKANIYAKAHRRDNPTHKLTVTSQQSG